MPDSKTFRIKPIRELIQKYATGIVIDPFANEGSIRPALNCERYITNDIDESCGCDYRLDALDFLKLFAGESVDTIIYDPPYSPRQVSECYKKLDKTVTMSDTNNLFYSRLRSEILRVLKPGGVIICCGWNSNGIGKKCIMPEAIDISQLYEIGNRKFFAAELKADGTFGAKEYHEGLIEIKVDFSQEVTEISADDNPAYISLAGPVTGEGTVKFAVLPYSVYSKFFNVIVDKNGAVVISGKAKAPKYVAFGYYSQVGDGSESLFTLYKATFSLPPLNSVSFDGKTIRDLTLGVKVYPYAYKDAAAKEQQATYSIINSETNKTIWSKAQTAIYVPDSTLV